MAFEGWISACVLGGLSESALGDGISTIASERRLAAIASEVRLSAVVSKTRLSAFALKGRLATGAPAGGLSVIASEGRFSVLVPADELERSISEGTSKAGKRGTIANGTLARNSSRSALQTPGRAGDVQT